jgi:Fe2+ or Zn2+ uptake regulation protein
LTVNSNELQVKGCKVTPQRRLILDILSNSESHVLTAEEIVNQARNNGWSKCVTRSRAVLWRLPAAA